jgi:hypothetical protein
MKTHVCMLKQARRAWYGKIDSFLMILGFTKSKDNPYLCFKIVDDGPVILFLCTSEENLITNCKKKLVIEFEMDLGLMHYFLGLEVWQCPEDIFLNQGKYVVEILKRFDMMYYKTMSTSMETNLKLFTDTSS